MPTKTPAEVVEVKFITEEETPQFSKVEIATLGDRRASAVGRAERMIRLAHEAATKGLSVDRAA